jgi:hypothetical protein
MSYDDNKLSDIEDLVVSTINELEEDIPIDETTNFQPLSDKYFDQALKLQKEIKNQYGISEVEQEIANKCFKRGFTNIVLRGLFYLGI